MSKLKPKYQHDCTACQFLGQFVTEGHKFDLYHCEEGGLIGPTLVYRHGDDGPEYGSVSPKNLEFMLEQRPDMKQGHPGVAAYKLAQQRGLIHDA